MKQKLLIFFSCLLFWQRGLSYTLEGTSFLVRYWVVIDEQFPQLEDEEKALFLQKVSSVFQNVYLMHQVQFVERDRLTFQELEEMLRAKKKWGWVKECQQRIGMVSSSTSQWKDELLRDAKKLAFFQYYIGTHKERELFQYLDRVNERRKERLLRKAGEELSVFSRASFLHCISNWLSPFADVDFVLTNIPILYDLPSLHYSLLANMQVSYASSFFSTWLEEPLREKKASILPPIMVHYLSHLLFGREDIYDLDKRRMVQDVMSVAPLVESLRGEPSHPSAYQFYNDDPSIANVFYHWLTLLNFSEREWRLSWLDRSEYFHRYVWHKAFIRAKQIAKMIELAVVSGKGYDLLPLLFEELILRARIEGSSGVVLQVAWMLDRQGEKDLANQLVQKGLTRLNLTASQRALLQNFLRREKL